MQPLYYSVPWPMIWSLEAVVCCCILETLPEICHYRGPHAVSFRLNWSIRCALYWRPFTTYSYVATSYISRVYITGQNTHKYSKAILPHRPHKSSPHFLCGRGNKRHRNHIPFKPSSTSVRPYGPLDHTGILCLIKWHGLTFDLLPRLHSHQAV